MKPNKSDIIQYTSLKLFLKRITRVTPSKWLIGEGISEEVVFKVKQRDKELAKQTAWKSFPN